MQTLTTESPKAALPLIRDSPATNGILEMIVRRPLSDERELLAEGALSLAPTMVGHIPTRRSRSSTRRCYV